MNKLQYLLVSELLKKGSVELVLPDGIILEVGITQENKSGDQEKVDDYCYVIATKDGKTALLDSYNLGLQFAAEENTIVCEIEDLNEEGVMVRSLDVV